MCPVSSRGSPKGRVINTPDDARTLLAESVIPVQAEGGLRRKAGLTRPQLCKRGGKLCELRAESRNASACR